jgi:phosphate transport system permease protein
MASRTSEDVRRRLRFVRRLGVVFHGGTVAAAVAVFLVLAAFASLLAYDSLPSIQRNGLSFFTNPAFSVVPVVVGTLLTSGLALLLAVPVALGVAILSAEVAPRRARTGLAWLVDLGAAVPSVVYGFWALEVLRPWMAGTVEPGLAATSGGTGPFSGLPTGFDYLTASVILAIMIIPTISAVARESLLSVPRAQREAVLSIGGTRWDATRIGVLGPARPGIAAGVILGLGRAIGETIAVALVIGNILTTGNGHGLPTSLFSPGATIPSVLVNEFGGAIGLQQNELIELGLILLGLSFAINLGARMLLRGTGGRPRPRGNWLRRARARRSVARPLAVGGVGPLARPAWWSRVAARRDRVLRRRKILNGVVVALVVAAGAAAVVPLVSLVGTAVAQGGTAVATPSFYTSEPPPYCLQVNASTHCPLGGIGPAIQGTLLLVGLGALIAVPVGLLTGIYLAEYGRGRFARGLGLLVDAMVGVPSILLGVFVFAFFLRFDPRTAESALSGAAALALLMLPIIARATETALRTVSVEVREAALALGFPRHRVTLRVVLGNAKSALLTGNFLALGRAGGETAALVFTAGTSSYWFSGLGSPIASLGPLIYNNLTIAVAPNWTIDAWGAALVLLLIMGALSLAARLVLRTERTVGSV